MHILCGRVSHLARIRMASPSYPPALCPMCDDVENDDDENEEVVVEDDDEDDDCY